MAQMNAPTTIKHIYGAHDQWPTTFNKQFTLSIIMSGISTAIVIIVIFVRSYLRLSQATRAYVGPILVHLGRAWPYLLLSQPTLRLSRPILGLLESSSGEAHDDSDTDADDNW
jgi:hypothetical protein